LKETDSAEMVDVRPLRRTLACSHHHHHHLGPIWQRISTDYSIQQCQNTTRPPGRKTALTSAII